MVHEPNLLDWVAFAGGLAVICFLGGKIVNHCFFRKKYISPMMDKLFQVQDVSRINNVKKANYTNKAINETTNPYKNAEVLRRGRTMFNRNVAV